MRVVDVYLLYAIVALVVFVILMTTQFGKSLHTLTKLFYITLIALVISLLVSPSVHATTNDERVWYNIFVLFIWLAPVVLGIIIFVRYGVGGLMPITVEGQLLKDGQCRVDQTFVCENGFCELVSEKSMCAPRLR